MKILSLFFLTLLPFSVFAIDTFVCNYYDYAVFKNNSVEIGKNGGLELKFIIDAENNTYYLSGNVGSTAVTPIANSQESAISFIEITETGNLNTTTINFNDFSSVHSRHPIFNKDMLPQQYYGKCEYR